MSNLDVFHGASANIGVRDDPEAFHRYFEGVATARFVIRKVFRIVNEQAKKLGLDPLEHQALVQIYGSESRMLQVNQIAGKLDISSDFASKLVKSLEAKGLVVRSPSTEDRRIVQVRATEMGMETLAEINEKVHIHVDYFQKRLDDKVKFTALHIFAFYMGLPLDPEDLHRLVEDPG